MTDRINPHLGAGASRRQVLRGAGIGVATLAFGNLLAACGGEDDASGAGKTKLSYQLEWLKITQFAGFFAAQENGYYKKEGIDATVNSGGPNISAAQLVGAGRADLGDDDNITLLQAIGKGLPLVMFATVFQKTPYSCISNANNPISTLQDMEGKTIAISAAGQAQLEPALQNAGVDASKVEIIPAGADPTQLVTGQADGYFGFATDQGVSLEDKGLSVVYASASDLGFGGYADVLFATKDRIAKDKDELTKFLRGTIMGYEWCNAHPDEAAELVVNKYGPKGQDLELQKKVAAKQVELIESDKGVMWMDPTQMQQIIDDQVAIKSIETPMKAEDVMTTSILEAAYDGKTTLLDA